MEVILNNNKRLQLGVLIESPYEAMIIIKTSYGVESPF